jgi:hypothetical protein
MHVRLFKPQPGGSSASIHQAPTARRSIHRRRRIAVGVGETVRQRARTWAAERSPGLCPLTGHAVMCGQRGGGGVRRPLFGAVTETAFPPRRVGPHVTACDPGALVVASSPSHTRRRISRCCVIADLCRQNATLALDTMTSQNVTHTDLFSSINCCDVLSFGWWPLVSWWVMSQMKRVVINE